MRAKAASSWRTSSSAHRCRLSRSVYSWERARTTSALSSSSRFRSAAACVAPLKAFFREGEKNPVLLVSAVEEGADVARAIQRGSGQLYRFPALVHADRSPTVCLSGHCRIRAIPEQLRRGGGRLILVV